MQIKIIDNRWLHLTNLTPDVESIIDEYFSASDPNSRYIVDSSEQGWDGVYRKYNRYKQILPKALLNDLKFLCKVKGIPYDIDDLRDPPRYPMFKEEDISPDLLKGITLMEHQIDGLKACANNEIGIMYLHTGAGKTELMAAIASMMQCPTMIIAEETVVIDQIKNRLELREVVEEVGIFYAGKTPADTLVCVGSIASIMPPPKLSRKKNEKSDKFEKRKSAYQTRMANSKKYRALASKCELLMIDEADKAVNNQYKKLVLNYTQSRYLYGFTGTMPNQVDEPVDHLHLKSLLGTPIVRSSRRKLEEIGRIIPVKYVMNIFGKEGNYKDKSTFAIAQKEWIDDNPRFHKTVKTITESLSNDNFLILVESIALGKQLESIIPGSVFIHGSTTVKNRNIALKDFENRDLRVLIGSKILKRGLDVKGGIDNLILCASSKKNSELEQKVGRALRLNDRGWARVFDFMFVCNHYLYKHSRARLRRMVDLGYPVEIVGGTKPIEGKQAVKRGFNLFRYT